MGWGGGGGTKVFEIGQLVTEELSFKRFFYFYLRPPPSSAM